MAHLHDFLHIGSGDTFIKNYYFGTQIKQKDIKVFFTIAVKKKKAFTEAMCERFYERSKEVFYESEANDPYKRFMRILKECNDILAHYRKDESSDFEVHMIASMVDGKNLHVSSVGTAEAYLVRGNHVNNIFDQSAADAENFEDVISGTVASDDVIIFNTGKLLRYITKGELVDKIAHGETLEDVLLGVKDIISQESHDQIGMSVLHVDGAREASIPTQKFKSWLTKIKAGKINKEAIVKQARALSHKTRELFKKTDDTDPDHKKKKLLIGLIGVSLLLLITIVIVRFSGSKQQLIKGYEAILSEVETDIDKASTLAITDKEKAQALLERAEERSREILSSGYLRRLTSTRLDQIQEVRNQIDGITTINELNVVADLASKKAAPNILGLTQYTNHFGTFEKNAFTEIILTNIEDSKILDDNDQFLRGTYFDDRESVVFITEGNRVVEYANGLFTYMDTQDTKWKPADALKTYDTKLYVMDKTNNQVWRYVRFNDTYGKATAYFKKETDLSSAVDIAIDGSIYLLRDDGTIEKYYGGEKVEMRINKAPLSKLQKPSHIVTDKDSSSVYVLDPGQKKIFIYAKNARSDNLTYQQQLYFKTLDTIRDFYVDRSTGKIYVADATKVYEVQL